VPNALGKGPKTLGKVFSECEEELLGMPFTVSSYSRGTFDVIDAVRRFFFEKSSSPSATLGEEILVVLF
jgi:hypothetical protein